jgi:hypothetical protein
MDFWKTILDIKKIEEVEEKSAPIKGKKSSKRYDATDELFKGFVHLWNVDKKILFKLKYVTYKDMSLSFKYTVTQQDKKPLITTSIDFNIPATKNPDKNYYVFNTINWNSQFIDYEYTCYNYIASKLKHLNDIQIISSDLETRSMRIAFVNHSIKPIIIINTWIDKIMLMYIIFPYIKMTKLKSGSQSIYVELIPLTIHNPDKKYIYRFYLLAGDIDKQNDEADRLFNDIKDTPKGSPTLGIIAPQAPAKTKKVTRLATKIKKETSTPETPEAPVAVDIFDVLGKGTDWADDDVKSIDRW